MGNKIVLFAAVAALILGMGNRTTAQQTTPPAAQKPKLLIEAFLPLDNECRFTKVLRPLLDAYVKSNSDKIRVAYQDRNDKEVQKKMQERFGFSCLTIVVNGKYSFPLPGPNNTRQVSMHQPPADLNPQGQGFWKTSDLKYFIDLNLKELYPEKLVVEAYLNQSGNCEISPVLKTILDGYVKSNPAKIRVDYFDRNLPEIQTVMQQWFRFTYLTVMIQDQYRFDLKNPDGSVRNVVFNNSPADIAGHGTWNTGDMKRVVNYYLKTLYPTRPPQP